MSIQGWFPLGLSGLISWLSQGLSRVLSSTTVWKYQFWGRTPPLWSKSHIRTWLQEKPWLWLYRSLSAKWHLCFFNTLPRFVIAFLPRSNLLIPWLQSPSTVILELKKRKSVTDSTFSPSFAMKWQSDIKAIMIAKMKNSNCCWECGEMEMLQAFLDRSGHFSNG